MINIRVENEYSKLEKVVLGIAYDFGPPPKINDCYDPKRIKINWIGSIKGIVSNWI